MTQVAAPHVTPYTPSQTQPRRGSDPTTEGNPLPNRADALAAEIRLTHQWLARLRTAYTTRDEQLHFWRNGQGEWLAWGEERDANGARIVDERAPDPDTLMSMINRARTERAMRHLTSNEVPQDAGPEHDPRPASANPRPPFGFADGYALQAAVTRPQPVIA